MPTMLERCLPHVLPFLPLGDVIAVSTIDPDVKKLVQKFLASGCVLIDENTNCQKKSLNLLEFGHHVTTLTLSGVDQPTIAAILPKFKCLQNLTIQKLVLPNESTKGYPTKLRKLTILDCKLNKTLVEKWFAALMPTLDDIQVCRSTFGDGKFFEKLNLLKNLRVMSLKDNIRSDSYGSFLSNPLLEKLEYHSTQRTHIHLDCVDTLQSLSIRDIEYMEKKIEDLKNLQHLHVSCAVTPELKRELQQGRDWKTFDVHSYDPSTEVNLLLKLNDDCLAHILSFLESKHLLPLRKVHSRFANVLLNHVVGMRKVTITADFIENHKKELKKDFYKRLGEKTKMLKMESLPGKADYSRILPYFTNLKELTFLVYFEEDENKSPNYDCIPSGLQKLKINASKDEKSLRKLFRRLDPTLTSLTVEFGCDLNLDVLEELHNLREFTFTCSATRNISGFLKRNGKNLEYLSYTRNLSEDDYECLMYPGSRLDILEEPFQLCYMKKLKVLHLHGLDILGDCDQMKLRPSNFPCLEEFVVIFEHYSEETIARVTDMALNFHNVKRLILSRCDREWNIEKLLPFTELTFIDFYCRELSPAEEKKLLRVIRALPKLGVIDGLEDLSPAFEIELRKVLLEQNRSIKFGRSKLLYYA